MKPVKPLKGETLDFVENKKNYTYRYAAKIVEEVIPTDVNNLAKNNGVTAEEVWQMVIAVSQQILPIDVGSLKILGIDR